MNSKKLYTANFTREPSPDCSGSNRSVIIVADSFSHAAQIAESRRDEGESIGLGEIKNEVAWS